MRHPLVQSNTDTIAQTVISECGIDMNRFATGKHYSSWMGLCLNHEIAGGKVRRRRTRRVRLRAAQDRVNAGLQTASPPDRQLPRPSRHRYCCRWGSGIEWRRHCNAVERSGYDSAKRGLVLHAGSPRPGRHDHQHPHGRHLLRPDRPGRPLGSQDDRRGRSAICDRDGRHAQEGLLPLVPGEPAFHRPDPPDLRDQQ
ncbi:MAG: transposase [Planctomycetes bacterium]|nr:transposase [Planctomycetota bacterium]